MKPVLEIHMRKIVGFPSLWLTMLGNVLEIKYSPQVMEITQAMVQNKPKSTQEASDKGWEEEYYAYLAEKEANAAVEEKDGAGGAVLPQKKSAQKFIFAHGPFEFCQRGSLFIPLLVGLDVEQFIFTPNIDGARDTVGAS